MKLDRLLVPVDFSESSPILIAYAKGFASLFHSEIHLVHSNEALMAPVSAESFGFEQVAYQDILQQIEIRFGEKLEEYAIPLRKEGIKVSSAVLTGRAHVQISDYAEQNNCGLILIGSVGHSKLHYIFLGSTTERLLRNTTKPVMSIRISEKASPGKIKNICVPVDFSDHAGKVIPSAIQWAEQFGSKLFFVHVDVLGKYMNPEEDILPQIESKFPALKTIPFKKVIIKGEKITENIIQFGEKNNIDCFMQTSHGSGKITSALLGSKADELIRLSQVPVVTYRILS
ncbi:MAG: universal stress protein [Bacteroidetes bacterium]|nr:universal stress protein [Bacteroidota bacterium]